MGAFWPGIAPGERGVNNAMDAYIKEQYTAKHRAVDAAAQLLEKQASELRRQVHDDAHAAQGCNSRSSLVWPEKHGTTRTVLRRLRPS